MQSQLLLQVQCQEIFLIVISWIANDAADPCVAASRHRAGLRAKAADLQEELLSRNGDNHDASGLLKGMGSSW